MSCDIPMRPRPCRNPGGRCYDEGSLVPVGECPGNARGPSILCGRCGGARCQPGGLPLRAQAGRRSGGREAHASLALLKGAFQLWLNSGEKHRVFTAPDAHLTPDSLAFLCLSGPTTSWSLRDFSGLAQASGAPACPRAGENVALRMPSAVRAEVPETEATARASRKRGLFPTPPVAPPSSCSAPSPWAFPDPEQPTREVG